MSVSSQTYGKNLVSKTTLCPVRDQCHVTDHACDVGGVVRCVKPNTHCVRSSFDNDFVSKQLRLAFTSVLSKAHWYVHFNRYTGMLEAVRVRKEGFAYRPFFSDFVKDYGNLVFKFTDKVICGHCRHVM